MGKGKARGNPCKRTICRWREKPAARWGQPAAAPSIGADLPLGPVQLGLVFSAFSWTYTPFQLPGGWLVDRVYPRILYPVIIMLWSLATLTTGLANGLIALIVVRMAVG